MDLPVRNREHRHSPTRIDFRYAVITRLATGPAAAPPADSLPATPPFSMITATAILGCPLTIPKPENHASGSTLLALVTPPSAGPVLPPTPAPAALSFVSVMAAGPPVPFVT